MKDARLLVIGETAAKLSAEHAEFLDQHPDIPWRNMRGMRNRIAHGYFDIDVDGMEYGSDRPAGIAARY